VKFHENSSSGSRNGTRGQRGEQTDGRKGSNMDFSSLSNPA